MRLFLLCCFTLTLYGRGTLARPQEVQVDPSLISEIFGKSTGIVPSAAAAKAAVPAVAASAVPDSAPTAVVQVVKTADHPADYVEPATDGGYAGTKADVVTNTEFSNCAEYTESLGYMCVPYYQCSNGTIITDGAGLIDIRNGFGELNPVESKCPGFLDVCCKDPDFVPPPAPKLIYQPKCGRHNVEGVGARIQGFSDSESQFGEWPHMCAVLFDKENSNGGTTTQFKCGGSLIAPGVILTGAHCVQDFRANPATLKVRCGEWDTQHSTEPYPHQDRYVSSLKIHPEFSPKNLVNDFALLFLVEDFQLDYHVDTVCLPEPNEVYDYQSCFATGWGKDKFGADGQYQVVLKKVDLTVVNNVQCENSLRATKLGAKFKLDNSFMCAGGVAGKDTCKGDGGSPLVCPSKADPNTFEQAGIVAWGIGCGENGIPGVYASVSKAACWIDQTMTCHYGANTNNFDSYWGFDAATCGAWKTRSLENIESLKTAAGNPVEAALYGVAKTDYQCAVNWVRSNEELDVAAEGYGRINGEDLTAGVEPVVRINLETEEAILDLVNEDGTVEEEEAVDDSGVNFG